MTLSLFSAALRGLAAAAALCLHGLATAQAPVEVQQAWVRATVPGQKATGGFMQLTAREPLALVGVRSPAAGVAELHEMKMDGDVMRMRALPRLALPAGQPVRLAPGGHHLMLLDLKQPLAKDSQVSLTLVFEDARGKASELTLQVPVGLAAPGATPARPAAAHAH